MEPSIAVIQFLDDDRSVQISFKGCPWLCLLGETNIQCRNDDPGDCLAVAIQ